MRGVHRALNAVLGDAHETVSYGMADACLRKLGIPASLIGKRAGSGGNATARRADIAAIPAAILIASMVTVLTIAPAALCADLVGRILNSRGEAISGVTVSVVNAAADIDAGKAVSDASGSYAISNLTPGAYKLNIVPGQWVMTYIGDKGLTVNWGLAPHSPPVAVATLGTAADSSRTSGASPQRIPHAQSRPETAGSGRVQGASD